MLKFTDGVQVMVKLFRKENKTNREIKSCTLNGCFSPKLILVGCMSPTLSALLSSPYFLHESNPCISHMFTLIDMRGKY